MEVIVGVLRNDVAEYAIVSIDNFDSFMADLFESVRSESEAVLRFLSGSTESVTFEYAFIPESIRHAFLFMPESNTWKHQDWFSNGKRAPWCILNHTYVYSDGGDFF